MKDVAMNQKEREKIIKLYTGIMEEAKQRFRLIKHITTHSMGIPPDFQNEFLCLQVRLLCETIALGCLAAHGEKAHALHKIWSANDIMKRLEELNPYFYPISLESSCMSERGIEIRVREKGIITKEELLKLYGLTGNYLHRGALKNYHKKQQDLNNETVNSYVSRIYKHILYHVLALYDGEWLVVCHLEKPSQPPNVMILSKGIPLEGE